MGVRRTRVGLMAVIAWSAACAPAPAAAQDDVEAFDGSWRLETGEVLTGGYMVEGDGFWIFMDTGGLNRGGVFRRDGDVLASFVPPNGAVRLEFERGEDGEFDEMTWREGDRALRGERVFPHAEGVFSGMEEWLAERGFTAPACWD